MQCCRGFWDSLHFRPGPRWQRMPPQRSTRIRGFGSRLRTRRRFSFLSLRRSYAKCGTDQCFLRSESLQQVSRRLISTRRQQHAGRWQSLQEAEVKKQRISRRCRAPLEVSSCHGDWAYVWPHFCDLALTHITSTTTIGWHARSSASGLCFSFSRN